MGWPPIISLQHLMLLVVFLITFEYCKVSFREMYEKSYTDVIYLPHVLFDHVI